MCASRCTLADNFLCFQDNCLFSDTVTLRQGEGNWETGMSDRTHPIPSRALAGARWECDLGLAVLPSASPSAPARVAVFELPGGQPGCGSADQGIANRQGNPHPGPEGSLLLWSIPLAVRLDK